MNDIENHLLLLVSSIGELFFNILKKNNGRIKSRILENIRKRKCGGRVLRLSRCIWRQTLFDSYQFLMSVNSLIRCLKMGSAICKVRTFNSQWSLMSDYLGVLISHFSTDDVFLKPYCEYILFCITSENIFQFENVTLQNSFIF